ncbi:TPA: hypothetical protein O4E34_002145 [Proteus mirabilis]|nr:hypothetical protein [Proteus mirabilis]HCZ8575529.1 hypothetical protein [Proteus mirabilis]
MLDLIKWLTEQNIITTTPFNGKRLSQPLFLFTRSLHTSNIVPDYFPTSGGGGFCYSPTDRNWLLLIHPNKQKDDLMITYEEKQLPRKPAPSEKLTPDGQVPRRPAPQPKPPQK